MNSTTRNIQNFSVLLQGGKEYSLPISRGVVSARIIGYLAGGNVEILLSGRRWAVLDSGTIDIPVGFTDGDTLTFRSWTPLPLMFSGAVVVDNMVQS